jgi:anhydro-N-acetylmuramic acid kinase
MNFSNLARKKQISVLGIMNGTSLDGVDFVLTRITRVSKSPGKKVDVKFCGEKSFSFPASLRKKLILAARHDLKVDALALLHHELGRFYAKCFLNLSSAHKKIDLIGLHGQTIFHQAPTATLQIGESSYLSAVSGVPVISDFRVSDLALGGQGAPIATLFHQHVMGRGKSVSIHNLGGISNLSMITAKGVEKAFDTGPANILMDMCLQKKTKGRTKFDRDGKIAARGKADLKSVEKMLAHPFFKKSPPKSCGREEFGETFLNSFLHANKNMSIQDQMATLLELTAWSIALSYKKYLSQLPEQIVFCGGGAKNKTLLKRIQQLLPECKVTTCDELGWPVSSIEGGAFALLAAFRLWDIPSNLPKTTGASRLTSMGKITHV